MYIKFENFEGVEHTIEGRKYTVNRKPGIAVVTVWPMDINENTEEYLLIPKSNKDWQRMYVMNDAGKTIDTLRTNEIPDAPSD